MPPCGGPCGRQLFSLPPFGQMPVRFVLWFEIWRSELKSFCVQLPLRRIQAPSSALGATDQTDAQVLCTDASEATSGQQLQSHARRDSWAHFGAIVPRLANLFSRD